MALNVGMDKKGAGPYTPLEQKLIDLSRENKINDFFISEEDDLSYKLDGEITYHSFKPSYEGLYALAERCKATGVDDHSRDIIIAGDYGLSLSGFRYRANFMKTMSQWRFVLRLLPTNIPEPSQIGVPDYVVDRFMTMKDGLVLLTGPTGSGKSTTIAALMCYRAKRTQEHILTLEDPIEYLLPTDVASLISQREVGADVESFGIGLKTALRQAPNMVMVGEIRDSLTAEAAIQLSETGHVVISTLHTTSADSTVQRFMKLIPADRVEAAQATLADVLKIVMCQRLVPLISGSGRTVIHEILVQSTGISAMIRQGRFEHIKQEMDTGMKAGQLTWQRSVDRKVKDGIIDPSWIDVYAGKGILDVHQVEYEQADLPKLERVYAD